MNLTFKGFLRQYCRELTGLKTDNLRKLAAVIATEAPHAAEALFLFAAEQDKANHLVDASSGTWAEALFRESARRLTESGSVKAFLSRDETPERFKKVRQAYEARTTQIQADRRVIALMRSRTLEALEEKGLSVYRLCADLKLNQGNIYAYLNKGDVSKVSRATARKIMDWAQAAAHSA